MKMERLLTKLIVKKMERTDFAIESYEHAYSNISSGNNMDWEQSKSKEGYYPIGVIGFRTARASLVVDACRVTSRAYDPVTNTGSCTIAMNARASGGSASAATATMQVLWVKVR